MDKPFSAYQGDEPYVFVCYAHDDAGTVYPELERLRDAGINVWYDEGIPPGSNWRAQVGGALDGAEKVLFYTSNASMASDHCNREINYALDEDKSIVPVLLDDSAMPADLKMGLSRVQMIHKLELSEDAYMRTLTGALSGAGPERDEQAAANARPKTRTGTNARAVLVGAFVVIVVGTAYLFYAYDPATLTTSKYVPQTTEVTQMSAVKRSIAVLPFVNMSSDPEQEYFSDGISEELLNLLAKNPDLKVISRSSAFTFKGKDVDIPTVAAQLGVAHVLEGSVRKAGNRVRITAQLIDAETDSHLWSATYDRELDDVFAIQDEIAGEVVEQLNVTLFGMSLSKKDINVEAYTLYLHARHLSDLGTGESLESAETMLKQVLAVEPDYGDAWLQLAKVYFRQGQLSALPREQVERRSKQALERARVLDPENAGVHATLALDAMHVQRDLASAARHLAYAIALEPTNQDVLMAASDLALNLGRLDDARAFSEYVTTRDPLCSSCFAGLGSIYMLQGKLDLAAEALETANLIGTPFNESNLVAALILLLQGELEMSLATWAKASPGPFRTYGQAITLYSMGREAEFAAKFEEMKEQFGADFPTMVARVYAWMGDKDSAFEWLGRYHVEHPELGPVIGNYWELLSVELHGLHDDPRWLEHLRRLGIAPEQLAAFEFNVPLPASG